jgi:hypothetical protein
MAATPAGSGSQTTRTTGRYRTDAGVAGAPTVAQLRDALTAATAGR